jgi:hypothetical protein
MFTKYYLVIDGERRGPFSKEELTGQGLQRATPIWHKGLPDWVAAGRVPDLLNVFDDPPPIPGAPPVAASVGDRPPLPEREFLPPSEQFKQPGVVLMPTESQPSSHDNELEDISVRLARKRIPYDAVGMRRLYLGGAATLIPGVVLLLAVALGIAILGLYGIGGSTPRFDPQRKEIVQEFNPAGRNLETLIAVGMVGAAVLGVLGVAAGAVCFLALLYRAWRIVYDGRSGPTPGRAVGFLFIPFFNLYWVFIAIFGLARALNRFVRRYDLDAPTASPPLGFTISLYSCLTYFPFPFAGLVPLTLNLIVVPIFMRSVYRTLAAICDEPNRERIANAPIEQMLRHVDLHRPLSANILSIVAASLAPIGLAVLVGGFCGTLDGMHHYHRDARRNDANVDGVAHFRAMGALNPADQNRLRQFQHQVDDWERNWSVRWRDHLIISSAVLGGGLILLTICLALAALARSCARSAAQSAAHVSPGWAAVAPLALLILLGAGEWSTLSAQTQLRAAVTLYASFDDEVQADRGGGNLRLSTRFGNPRVPGEFVFKKDFDRQVFRIAKGKGIHGGALEVVDVLPDNGRIFFPAKGNLAYKKAGWGGAVSVWINTDPNTLFKTPFCDPVQITQKGANNGGIWFDFNGAKPRRDLRMGAFPAVPAGQKPISEEDAAAPMVRVPAIDLKAGQWHHVVVTWNHFDTRKPDAVAALYIDGKHIGDVKNRPIAMDWDIERAGIYVAVNFIGLLDEFAVFGRPLTADDVVLLHREPGVLAMKR